MNSGILVDMDTSMLGRVAALLIRDLGRSLVIFLALVRGQDIDCTHFHIILIVGLWTRIHGDAWSTR
jgi:hypothetical protein